MNHNHNTRETFERELQRLQQEIVTLGSMVETALLNSVEILKRQDTVAARQLMRNDCAINQRRFTIEEDTMAAIALHQPVARDMRILAAILEIATELERMGDYAKGIGKITLLIGAQPLIKPLIDIPQMAITACAMLRQALDAFVALDADAARAIPATDERVDALYNQVYRELITYILADPKCIEQANYLLWCAHNLERTADRVTNICERVVFTVTGELLEFNGSCEV